MNNFLTIGYYNCSKKNCVKFNHFTPLISNVSFKWKTPFNPVNPSILIKVEDILTLYPSYDIFILSECNYVKYQLQTDSITYGEDSETRNRYYYINDVTYISNDLILLELHIDVLTTYYYDYYSQSLFIERSSSNYNSYLEDTEQSFTSDYTLTDISLTMVENIISYNNIAVFLNVNYSGTYTTVSGSNYFGNVIKNIDNYTYVINTDSFVTQVLNDIKTNGSFASSIKSMYKLPVNDNKLSSIFPSYNFSGNDIIYFNYPKTSINSLTSALFTSSLDSSYINYSGNTVYTIKDGPLVTFTLCKYTIPDVISDYTDINHSKYIFGCPFIGSFEIDIREYNNSDIVLLCSLDMRTGASTLMLYNTTQNKILRVDNIDITMKVDTTTTNAQELKDKANIMGMQFLTGTIGNVANAFTSLPSKGAELSGVTSALGITTNLANTITQAQAMHTHTYQSGSNNDYSKYTFPVYMYLHKYKYNYTALNNAEFGKPLNEMKTIGSLSGYIKVGGMLSNLSVYCSEAERDELISLLQNGIYKI